MHRDGTITIGSRAERNVGSDTHSEVSIAWRDTGDAGDTYTFDQPAADTPRAATIAHGRIETQHRSDDRVVFELSGVLTLPRGLTPDRTTRDEVEEDNPIALRIELRSGEPFLRAAIVLDNIARDHRLQMVVAITDGGTNRSPKSALRVLNQFAWEDPEEHRKNLTLYDEGDLPQTVRRLMLGAREPEIPRFVPNDRAFVLGRASAAVLVAHRGLHELEPLDDGSVAATIVRCVGWLARGDLSSRTGDAGPEIFTPDAQCRRRIVIPFSLAPLSSLAAAEDEHTTTILEEMLHPVPILGSCDDTAIRSERVFAALPQDLVPRMEAQKERDVTPSAAFSILKVREDGMGAVMRLFNPGHRPVIVRWETPVVPFTLAEHPRDPHADAIPFHEIPPGRIYTVALPVAPDAPRRRSHRGLTPRERFALALEERLPYRRFGIVPRHLSAHAWSLIVGDTVGGAPGFEPGPDAVYIRATLATEEARLARLDAELAEAAAALHEARNATKDLLEPTVVQCASRVSTLTRQTLEAELSVLFARRLRDGGDRETFYRQVREIALKLNHARVEKRADDYLVALLER